jgi:hypothetical protein
MEEARMDHDESEPITTEEADRIAKELTNGEVSVEADESGVRMRRRGFVACIELYPQLDLTKQGIQVALDDWKDWPEPPV